MRLWLKDPIAVLADGAGRGLVVQDGRIVELVDAKAASPDADAVFEAGRHVVIPGLVNSHHHFFQTLTRAHPQAINKELFPWLAALYPIWARHLNRDNFRLSVRLALTELLISGCTTASDHHFIYPPGLEDAVDIEDEEASGLRMRMTLTRGTVNLRACDGGIADDRVIQDDDVLLADYERVLNRYHDRSDGSFRQVALAPCAPFNVTKKMGKGFDGALQVSAAHLLRRELLAHPHELPLLYFEPAVAHHLLQGATDGRWARAKFSRNRAHRGEALTAGIKAFADSLFERFLHIARRQRRFQGVGSIFRFDISTAFSA
jgi:cytosine/adenosine deaminase-related metal-dependent hydrolase